MYGTIFVSEIHNVKSFGTNWKQKQLGLFYIKFVINFVFCSSIKLIIHLFVLKLNILNKPSQ